MHSTLDSFAFELDELRQTIAPERSTFHVFEYRGRRILYDLCTGTLLEPNRAAFELLGGLERDEPTAVLTERLSRTLPIDDLASVVTELRALVELGLFRLERLESEGEREATLRAHMEMPTRAGQVLVQTSCNLKCTYCYEVAAQFHGTGKSMSVETGLQSLELLFERLGRRKHLDVTFFGGEPLLNFQLVRQLVARAYERAKELDKTVSFKLTTNATLLDDEKIRFLVEHQFAVMISLDGPPQAADLQRIDHAGRGTTAKATTNARRLIAAQRAAGVREAMIRATMTTNNRSRAAIAEYFAEQDFRRTMIGASEGRAHAKQPHDLGQGDTSDQEIACEQALDGYLAWRRGEGERPLAGLDFTEGLERVRSSLGEGPKIRRAPICGTGRNTTAVTEHGDLYPCHRYVGEDAYKIGTLRDGIDSTRLRRYFTEIFDGYDKHCSHCWARALCGGQCPWYLSRPDGHVGTPDEQSCDEIRHGSERMLWLAATESELGPAPETQTSVPSTDAGVEA